MKGTTLEDAAIVMTPEDTVGTAITDLVADRTLTLRDDHAVTLTEPSQFGHKCARGGHEPDDEVGKYGAVIGRATTTIRPGDWVHTHNVESIRGQPAEDRP